MTDTPLDTAAIRARCDAATDGPWGVTNEPGVCAKHPDFPKAVRGVFDLDWPEDAAANCEFAAHARTDIPALLDALAARDAEIARLKEEVATLFLQANQL